MDHIEELKCYLSKVFESKTHPLGKVMRILVLTFEASYSPQHPAILHIALRNVSKFKSRILSSKNLVTINCHRKRIWNTKSEIRSVLNCLHNILRCLFFGLPKPGGRDDLRSGPGPLILPTLLPKIYASLQGNISSHTAWKIDFSFQLYISHHWRKSNLVSVEMFLDFGVWQTRALLSTWEAKF